MATAAYFPGTAAVPILPDGWVRFSQATLDGALVQGKSVLVDATADWCATCQVNEAAVLLRPDVSALLKGYGVVRLRADYTRPDPEIQKWLASVGRAGLPVYVLYRPGRQVYFFPEILTDDTFTRVMEAQTPMSPSSCLPASRACSRPMAD